MKILIVDDSKAIFSMVSQMLQTGGHTSVWAEDGLKAIEKIKEDPGIELILLDWNMPNMNGLEFLEKNQSDHFTSVPIIMMTTENSPEFIRKALSLNASEYIMKPFTSDILLNKITLIQMMF